MRKKKIIKSNTPRTRRLRAFHLIKEPDIMCFTADGVTIQYYTLDNITNNRYLIEQLMMMENDGDIKTAAP